MDNWLPDGVFHVEKCGCAWEQEWAGEWGDMTKARLALKISCVDHLDRVGTYRYARV